MAKFCANCGAPMDEEDRVCGQCGTPAGGTAPASGRQKKTAGAGGSGKAVKLIAAAVAVVIVVVVAVNLIGSFTGYRGTLNKVAKALKDYDVDTIESLASSITEETLGMDDDDLYDYYDSMVTSILDEFEDNVGEVRKISYEITSETELSDRRLENLKEELTDYYNMDTSDIKKVIELDLRLTVKGKNESSAYNVRDLCMVKESGGWKVVYQSINY